LTSAPTVMLCCTATMSARGTMMLSILHSRRARMFLSIVASVGENPDSRCSPVSTSSRSARVAAAFQPNRMRITRVSQPSCGSAGCGTTMGRRRCSLSLDSLRWGAWDMALGKGGCRCQASASGLGRAPIGVGNRQPPQDVALGLFHRLGIRVLLVIVAQKVEKTMDGQMGDMMRKGLSLAACLPRDGVVGENDVAKEWRPFTRALRREREHVRRLVDAPPDAVERSHCRIIGEDDSKLGPRCGQRRGGFDHR